MNNRVSRTLISAGAAAVTLLGLGVAPAQAASHKSPGSPARAEESGPTIQATYTCGSTYEVCLFRGSNFTLGERDFDECDDDVNFADNHFDDGYGLNDRVSSVYNYSREYLSLWEHSWFRGRALDVNPNSYFSSLGSFDNLASSLDWHRC